MTRKSKPHDPSEDIGHPGVCHRVAPSSDIPEDERRENFERMWEALADLETD